ncbi:hypothetical protein mRhiFer1_009371 [Rhinolophus ferrumequinum]|uniref:Uncharacterized protein n=1 Tax=Rhinolophus ferrumequinum TaxID=59479 RepID=A0A7J7RQA2_RHIFE|nr:hypothetical protein mRhiFer1_009371 [Rhinolophus ferrumequinum]
MGLFCASLLPAGRGEEAVRVWEEQGPSPRLHSGRGSSRGKGYAILKGEGFQERRRPRPGGVARRRTLGLFPPPKGNGLQPALPQGLRGNSARFLSPPPVVPDPRFCPCGAKAGRQGSSHAHTRSCPHHTLLPSPLVLVPSRGAAPSACARAAVGFLRPLSKLHVLFSAGGGGLLLVCWSCHHKIPQTGWRKQQRYVFSRF